MFANKKTKQIPFLYRSETHMSIFNYIYRRPFSFSDPTQKIQAQQQQKTYQHYCHLNDLMIKSTWLPVRKKKKGGGGAVTGWTIPKPVSWLLLTQCYVSCQWGSWSFYCCVHRCIDPSTTWHAESRVKSQRSSELQAANTCCPMPYAGEERGRV